MMNSLEIFEIREAWDIAERWYPVINFFLCFKRIRNLYLSRLKAYPSLLEKYCYREKTRQKVSYHTSHKTESCSFEEDFDLSPYIRHTFTKAKLLDVVFVLFLISGKTSYWNAFEKGIEESINYYLGCLNQDHVDPPEVCLKGLNLDIKPMDVMNMQKEWHRVQREWDKIMR